MEIEKEGWYIADETKTDLVLDRIGSHNSILIYERCLEDSKGKYVIEMVEYDKEERIAKNRETIDTANSKKDAKNYLKNNHDIVK